MKSSSSLPIRLNLNTSQNRLEGVSYYDRNLNIFKSRIEMPNISLLTNRRLSSISQNLDLAFGTNASRGDSNTRILSNIISTELLNLNNETRNYLEKI